MTGVFWLGLLTGLPSSSKRSFGEPADLIILKRFRNDRICLFDDISISWIPALRARMTGGFWLVFSTGLPRHLQSEALEIQLIEKLGICLN